MKLQVPRWLRSIIGRDLLWKVKSSTKVIYLTFDDGPIPEVTPLVVEILKSYNWKATFFCVGENVSRYPEVFTLLLEEGHRVGNHTFNHMQAFRNPADVYLRNVYKAREWIDSRLFRPPHGQLTGSLKRALMKDFTVVMWDVLTYDYDAGMKEEEMLKILKRELRPGSIVVFHDSLKARDRMLKVLPKALEYWKSEGYTFGLL